MRKRGGVIGAEQAAQRARRFLICQGASSSSCQLLSMVASEDGWELVYDVGTLVYKPRLVVISKDGTIEEVRELERPPPNRRGSLSG